MPLLQTSTNDNSYESDAKPYIEHSTSSFASNSSYAEDATSMALLQHFSQPTHTPPMSPANQRPNSSGSASSGKAPINSSPLKVASTPSQSSTQSNPFSTPPTSPAEAKDEMDEFLEMPDNSYSQFELELQAMGTMDGSCDFLDFTV